MRALVVLLVASSTLLAERVTFKTDDGKQIVGTFQTAGKDAPTVICLPMFRNVRKSYQPLVGPLVLKGINVLAIDLRGHGESAPELADDVVKRNARLFQAMHLDVKAAIDFLEQKKGCDRTRIGLIGASVGCSVAIDATRRYPGDVRAVVILTPGSKYLGVDSLAHLKEWPGTRIFTFVSSEEKRTSAKVMEALDPFDGSNRMVVPGKEIHGTRMFGKVNQIEELIARFFATSLLGKVDLRARDGTALHRKTADMEAWFTVGPNGVCEASVKAPWKGSVVVKVGKQSLRIPIDPKKVDEKKATFFEKDGRVGVLIPLKVKPGTDVDVEFRARTGKKLRFPQKGRFTIQPAGASDD